MEADSPSDTATPSPPPPGVPSGSSTTKIPKPSAQPRKGILKRSGSVSSPRSPLSESGSDGHDLDSAVRRNNSLRALPWSPPTGSHSKIPKLSVTWWETSSAYGDTPSRNRRAKSNTPPRHIEHHEQEHVQEIREEGDDADDNESIHSCSSSIAGTWWFGRQTRYVPHCDKRHLHFDDSEQYLTPTQRKNREIAELRKQLKTVGKTVEEKDVRLDELRERLAELEKIMDQGGLLVENHRLIAKLNFMKDEYERDKKNILDEFEIRLRKSKSEHQRDSAEREASLQFELDELRSRIIGDESAMKAMDDSDSGISRSLIIDHRIVTTDEKSTITDGDFDALNGSIQQELQAYKYENMLLRNRVSELEFSLKQFEKDFENEEPCENKSCTARQRSMVAHLEAYKNECLVWRTKSSEMEIALKQQTNIKNALEQQMRVYEQQLQLAKLAAEQAASSHGALSKRNSIDDSVFRSMLDDADEGFLGDGEISEEMKQELIKEFTLMRNRIRRLESQLDDARKKLNADYHKSDKNSAEYKELAEEIARLSAENDSLISKTKSLDRQLEESRRTINDKEELLKTSEQLMLNLDQQIVAKRTELEVMQLTYQKLRDENDKISSEKLNLEDKIHNLEITMAECGIMIGPAANLRRKMSRSSTAQQTVYRARDVQTDLNWQEELQMENDLKDLRENHDVLQHKYDDEISDLENRVTEISANLILKNNLVNTLTNQIQVLQDEIAALHEGFERERFMHNQKMHEINLIAQRVPFLEQDVNTAREELRAMEQEYNKERDRFEKTLEGSMNDVFKTQQDTSLYFRQRLENAEKLAENMKQKWDDCKQELSDERMRFTLRNVELERQLEANLHEVQKLQTKIFANRRHIEIQAQPETTEKAVLCYVRTNSKGTEVLKGDLYDERDEQLKVLQGELHATRRQVEVLQDKLLVQNILQQQLSEAEIRKQELNGKCSELQKKLEILAAERKIERDDFDLKYRTIVEEKEQMAREERDRYHRLEAEFDNVRQEMDDVIKRYESKKAEMKSKLEELEKESEDRKRLEEDVRILRDELDQLESNYEREKSELQIREDELIAMRDRVKTSLDLLSKKEVQPTDFVDISGLEKQIREMTEECDVMKETDILGSSSDLQSISTIGAEECIPILVFAKPPPPSQPATVDDDKSPTKSPDMVSARDSLSATDTEINPVKSNVENGFESSERGKARGISPEERQELVDSIQAQTHLLQSLRAELEEEQKKHKDVKTNLYERIQKLACENATQPEETLTSSTADFIFETAGSSVVPEALLRLAAENFSKTPSLREAVVEIKAKVLYLMHENQELRSDMKELKNSVSMLVKHPSLVNLRKADVAENIPTVTINDDEEIYASAIEEQQETVPVVELEGLRDDLNKIAAQFDLTSKQSEERLNEEAILMKWLKHELAKEKCELDVLIKWYETDKAKLELQLVDYKIRTESSECERDFYRKKYEKTYDQLNDLGRELTFYKQEEPLKFSGLDKRTIKKYHSDSALCQPSAAARKRSFKEKLRKTTKDLFGLERRFVGMEHDRKEVQRELDMLRGEFVMLQMQYDTDKNYWVGQGQNSVMTQSAMSCDESAQTELTTSFDAEMEQSVTSAKEFNELKKQLHHAEQCAARLDAEATHWQRELVCLKSQLRNTDSNTDNSGGELIDRLNVENQLLKNQLYEAEKGKDEVHAQMTDLRRQLTTAEQNAASLETEVGRYGEKCMELKNQLATMAAKQQQLLDRRTAEVDGRYDVLKSRYEHETAVLRDEITILKKALDAAKRDNLDMQEKFVHVAADERETSETETVVTLLNNLEERKKEIDDKDSKLAAVVTQADEIRRKYEAEVADLLNQLECEKKNQSAKAVTIKNQVETTLSSLAENLRASNEEVLSIKEQYEMVIDKLQQKLESETFRLKVFEEKAAHFEREFQMVTKELELRCKSFDKEKAVFEKENADLRKRLYSAALSIEVAEKSMDVENALDTAHELQEKLTSLMEEMEEKEKKHKEMYAVMFQKGQNAARAELLSAGGMDTASSSSTEWIFESGATRKTSSPPPPPPIDVDRQHEIQQQPSTSAGGGDVESRIQKELHKRKESGDSRLNEDEVRLRFLRDAVYYYLLGRDTRDHLQAIMSILKFSERQRHDVIKAKSLS